jgi:Ca2+-binding EF-hand superfamily protein
MKVSTTLVFGAAALALGMGSVLADRPKNDPGFNALDRNNDGYLSRVEAARNADLAKNFKAADKNGDGKLSRAEYLAVMTKKDLRNAKDKVTKGDRDASAGSTRPQR